MYRSISLLASVVVPVFMLAVACPASAQDKAKLKVVKATNSQKVLHDDDRVRVTETTTKPGENGANVVRGKRVTRYIQGGTQERTYNDGRKEKIERKTGEVFVAGPDKEAYSVKNIGKTTTVTYTVTIKEPKK
jgi:mannose-6-phosphate isomerase-like protein (cupin superfamily)